MASGSTGDEMPDDLVRFLSGGRLIIAATVDTDGQPYTMVMNSALAVDARTIRFCIDHRTRSLKNLRANGRVMFEIVGDGLIYGVRGRARIIAEQMSHVPVPSAMVEVDVELVKRDLPPGVEVEAPVFRWGALESYMRPIDPLMFDELRSHPAAAT